MEVEEGGKISVTLGHLIIICNIVDLFIFILTFFAISLILKMLTFSKYTLKSN